MAYPIEKKLVIAVASSALFDLTESHRVYQEQGVDAYRRYQEEHIDDHLERGAAFPFIKRLLKLNDIFTEEKPIEVVLLSRNNPETGLRVFRTIKHYGLDISRASFFSGESPYRYIPAFNASLFLSAERDDVVAACKEGFAAGQVLSSTFKDDDEADPELRIAFDFDGVIANDEAEKIYKKEGMEAFHNHESQLAQQPMQPGLLGNLIRRISDIQHLESAREKDDSTYKRIIKTSIVTARSAPSHERVVMSLKSWGVEVHEAFFLGGIDKARILDIMHPHMFFDDQIGHLQNLTNVPAVHIPFGVANM